MATSKYVKSIETELASAGAMIQVLSSFDEYLCPTPTSRPTTPLVPGQNLFRTQGKDDGHIKLVVSESSFETALQR